jgi:hypothetical protein
MNQLILESRQPQPQKNLVVLPVKEREKIQLELVSRQKTCAIDVMGLSWIFLEDDDY